jgi:hypothetical protein
MPATGARRPNILDVVQAVTALAPDHPEVSAWWYVPAGGTRDALAHAGEVEPDRPIDVVVEVDGARTPDLVGIGAQLSERLWKAPVNVRAHRGAAEGQTLYRLVTRRT